MVRVSGQSQGQWSGLGSVVRVRVWVGLRERVGEQRDANGYAPLRVRVRVRVRVKVRVGVREARC